LTSLLVLKLSMGLDLDITDILSWEVGSVFDRCGGDFVFLGWFFLVNFSAK